MLAWIRFLRNHRHPNRYRSVDFRGWTFEVEIIQQRVDSVSLYRQAG